MACQAMYMWSLSGLVGAFLDLAIAYFLLCASVMAFIASNFLGFFGLCLPCPCNGLFGTTNPNSNFCFQKLLIDYPTEEVSNVQLSVKKKFPFNEFILEKEQNGNFVGRLVDEREYDNNFNGFVEMEGEASCSSVSDARKSHNVVRLKGDLNERNGNGVVREGRFDVKGKGVMNQRPRGWLRRRRKGGVDYGKGSLVSSCEFPRGDVLAGPLSPASSINKGGIEMVDDRMLDLDNGVGAHDSYYIDDGQASRVMRLRQRDSSLFDEFHDENDEEKNFSSIKELKDKAMASNVGEENTIEFLEQALKEERAARSAIYLELEKERSAAATAADEAMAMILRLQEEKGSFEMEARQYQRIIEEKSAYDAEEMNILKEILVRREREKHFLEKEVEAYRQMINLANEQLPDDGEDIKETQNQPLDSVLDPREDPVLMLHQLSASIDKKALIKDLQTSLCCSNGDPKFQEKEMVSMGGKFYLTPQDGQRSESFPVSCELGISQEHNFPEKTIPIIGEEDIQDGSNLGQGILKNNLETHERIAAHIPKHDENLEQHRIETFEEGKDSCALTSEKELQVHDIHVILDGSNLCNEDKRNQGEWSPENASSEGNSKSNLPPKSSARLSLDVIRDCPSTSSLNAEIDILISTSEISGRLPPIGPRTRSIFSDPRRNSMSAMDIERLKIDHEVGRLRERLKIVQEGREKLNPSMEHREREKIKLNLLEDISRQLQEICQLTESGETVRQTSLPPPSTKVMSKKRRCRSVSSGVEKSS